MVFNLPYRSENVTFADVKCNELIILTVNENTIQALFLTTTFPAIQVLSNNILQFVLIFCCTDSLLGA